MDHLLSGHLKNAAILVASASIALAADALAPDTTGSVGRSVARVEDISGFADPVRWEHPRMMARAPVESDPFRAPPSRESLVASTTQTPTVRASSGTPRGRVLSAILVADDRRVAVIDDEVVGTGD